jgi:hypothetical protein
MKNALMKLFTFLLFAFLCANVSAQTISFDKNKQQVIESEELNDHLGTWSKLLESEDISIQFKFENCYSPSRGTNHEKIYFQISNHTNTDLTIEYWMQKWQDEVCLNCVKEGSSYLTKLVIPANKIITGTCDEKSDRQLELFSKMLEQENQAHITKLKITNFKVHTLN